MSTLSSTPSPELTRFELAQAAALTERRNRPTRLLTLAIVLLLAVLVSLVLNLSSRNSALRAAQAEEAREKTIAATLAEIRSLREQSTGRQQSGLGEPLPRFIPDMERLAQQAGLAATPTPPRITPPETARRSTPGGPRSVRVEYYYSNVRDARLRTMLAWTELAARSIPGLSIAGIVLNKEGEQWRMDVIFQRWERLGPGPSAQPGGTS